MHCARDPLASLCSRASQLKKKKKGVKRHKLRRNNFNRYPNVYLGKQCYEYCRGKVPRSHNGSWPIVKFDHVRGEGVGTRRALGPILMGPKLFKGRSEEECLFGRTKYGSNTHLASSKESLQRALVVRMSPTNP